MFTTEKKNALASFLTTHELVCGLGTLDAPCSIAAINLVLTGRLTDDVPDCMSDVIGHWIIGVQDAMPAEIRNSSHWKSLLPNAAGTGRVFELERKALVMTWMWATVLPTIQNIADASGFGTEWRAMCDERTDDAARAVWGTAAITTRAGRAARFAAAHAGRATRADVTIAGIVDVTIAARDAAAIAGRADVAFWVSIDPCGLLEQLINVGD